MQVSIQHPRCAENCGLKSPSDSDVMSLQHMAAVEDVQRPVASDTQLVNKAVKQQQHIKAQHFLCHHCQSSDISLKELSLHT